jgi:transcriptional regulator GlxA family with amidase domain
MTKTFGIVLFPDAEELDFAGPFEVFGMYCQVFDKDWRVITIAEQAGPLRCAKGLVVVPDATFESAPPVDVLVVPGGAGTRREVDNERLIDYVRRTGERARWTASVCTGAFILHRAGFLAGKRATTHWASLNRLRELPDVEAVEERVVDEGKVITAAGVSSGIDMALHIIGLLRDPETARNVQKAIEYYPEPPYAEGAAVASGKEARS